MFSMYLHLCLYVNKRLNSICPVYEVIVSFQKPWIKFLIHMDYFYKVLMNFLRKVWWNGFSGEIKNIVMCVLNMTSSFMCLEQHDRMEIAEWIII